MALLSQSIYLIPKFARREIICIQRIKTLEKVDDKKTPWQFSFELRTHARSLLLLAPTAEERDLWVNGFNRILQIPVIDPNFVPMGMMTKAQLNQNLHEQFMATEGNNVTGANMSKDNQMKNNLSQALQNQKREERKRGLLSEQSTNRGDLVADAKPPGMHQQTTGRDDEQQAAQPAAVAQQSNHKRKQTSRIEENKAKAMSANEEQKRASPAKGQKQQQQAAGGAGEQQPEDFEVDEVGTIHLIDSLDPESKKVLNSLVQSVLITQQENEKQKLDLLGKKRTLIQAQRNMMQEKFEAE